MSATVTYLPVGSENNFGIVSVGQLNGLSVSGGKIQMRKASKSYYGTVRLQDGGGLELTGNDLLYVRGADEENYGIVKPDGVTLSVSEDTGMLSVIAVASKTKAGLAKVDGTTITADWNGTLHAVEQPVRMDIVTDENGRKRLAYIVRKD